MPNNAVSPNQFSLADIPIDYVKIKSYTINDVELAKINYNTIIEDKFTEYPILNYLRGSVFIKLKKTYTVLYRAMNRFNYPANIESFDNCIEKLDGMMILPYIFEGEVYFSSRWSFDTPPVKMAESLATYDYKEFIIKCYRAGIYLTFELVTPLSFIKTIYPSERYGLYLIASQDINGKPYPLINKDNEVWVTNEHLSLKVPKNIMIPKIYDFKKMEELDNYFDSFKGREFEGVVVYKNGTPYKVKTEQYKNIKNTSTALYRDMALSVIDGTYDRFPNKELMHKFIVLYDDILTLFKSFKYMVKKYRSKKAIAKDIEFLPSYFRALFYLFENREDRALEILHKYYLDRVVEIGNLDVDIQKEEYISYV